MPNLARLIAAGTYARNAFVAGPDADAGQLDQPGHRRLGGHARHTAVPGPSRGRPAVAHHQRLHHRVLPGGVPVGDRCPRRPQEHLAQVSGRTAGARRRSRRGRLPHPRVPARAGDPEDLLHRAGGGAAHHAAAGHGLAFAAAGRRDAAGVPARAGADRRSADRRGTPPAGPLRPRAGALARPGDGLRRAVRTRADHRRPGRIRTAGQPDSRRVVGVAAGAVPRLRHGGPRAVRPAGAVCGRARAHPVQHQRVSRRRRLDAPGRARPGADRGGRSVPAQHRRLRHRAGLRADGDAVRRGGRARGAGPVPLPGRLAGPGGCPPDRRPRLGPAVHADPHPGQRRAHVAEPRRRRSHRGCRYEPHLYRPGRRGLPHHRRLRGRRGRAGRRAHRRGGGLRPRLRAGPRGAADRGPVLGSRPAGLEGRGGRDGPADGRRDAGTTHGQ